MRATARAQLGLAAETRLLLAVGNSPATKGFDLALAALAQLPSDVCLALAGRIPAGEASDLLARSDVGERVLVWPHVDDPMLYYAAADVLVAPSREDSFHLPALEAMACGLPVVLSASAGVSELVADGKEALVVDDPTDVASLTAAIRCLLDDAELRERLVTSARALAQRSSWAANADATAALVEREARTPRVLLLTTEALGVGGIQRATRSLAAAAADAFGDDRVGTLSLRASSAARIRGRLLWRGGAGDEPRVGAIAKARFAAAATWTARRWRRRGVLIATHPHLSPVAWACRLVSGVPYAVWCHGIEAWSRPRLPIGVALRAADAVFAPSSFTARRVEHVARLQPGSVRVVPHSVPALPSSTDRRSAAVAERPVILTVARLTPANRYKGVDMLLYALPQILRDVDVELEIVGDGSDRRRLERISRVLRVDGHVRFLGSVDDADLDDAYRRASVFAMPARHRLEPTPEGEGFGLVYVEAGAHRLPVVAGRGAGADEAVEEGVSGLLVDPEDPSAVADAIVGLVRDPAGRERLGEGGRRLAETRFSAAAFRDATIDMVFAMNPPALVR